MIARRRTPWTAYAIIRELSNREKGKSSEPAPTSGGDRPWALCCVEPEVRSPVTIAEARLTCVAQEYEAMASLLSKHDLLDALPQYLEDVRNTMIAMQDFKRKMLSEPSQLFILCRYRYGQQSLEDVSIVIGHIAIAAMKTESIC